MELSQHFWPGCCSPKETKILGVRWNKTEDKLSIGLMKPLQSVVEGTLTKRKMLSAVNGV